MLCICIQAKIKDFQVALSQFVAATKGSSVTPGDPASSGKTSSYSGAGGGASSGSGMRASLVASTQDAVGSLKVTEGSLGL
jgi:hypothetical protein